MLVKIDRIVSKSNSVNRKFNMARIAVLSDIHANLHAFEAVLNDIAKRNVDEIWCLGDIVGYGAFPSECIKLASENCSLILSGNHDLAVSGLLEISSFNWEAKVAIEWTSEKVEESDKSFLKSLDSMKILDLQGKRLVVSHGSPLNPVWEYVLTYSDINRVFYFLDENEAFACLHGHSHLQFFASSEAEPPEISKGSGKMSLNLQNLYVINPGSVGQPRDYDWRAAYLIIDFKGEELNIEFLRVEYDVEEAARAIVEEGLPVFLASRLRAGY